MSAHLRDLVGQLEDMTLKDVETRLANWLIKRCPQPESDRPVTIELKTTKRVLAAELTRTLEGVVLDLPSEAGEPWPIAQVGLGASRAAGQTVSRAKCLSTT